MKTESKKARFLKAYDDCHDQFARYCAAVSNCRMDSEDLMQEVLLVTYQKFDQLKDKHKLLHFLIRTAKFKYIDGLRKQKHKGEYNEKWAGNLEAQGASPEIIHDIQVLYGALDKLSTSQRNAIILFEINGFSIKEIAEIQQSSEGAIKTKISRGRQKLKELLRSEQELNTQLRTLQIILL